MKREGVLFVILGATGDLTKRKLIPGIYNLIRDNKLENFEIIGASINKTTPEKLIDSSKKFIEKPNPKIINILKKKTSYLKLNFFEQEDYIELKKLIDSKKKLQNKIFHFATMPGNFATISENLKKNKLVDSECKVVFEKPFGHNLKSAKKINKKLKKIFSEKQIYRIDHYLGKELVGNISLVRFTNRILEPLWNNEHIEQVQIILDEDMGVVGRGPYYDKYGAIKDVVQNHILQLISLIGMESPKKIRGDYIRNEKVKVLKRTKIVDVIVGQYAGYKKEKGVDKNSKIETFAALKMLVNNSRWKGVPFFIRTGKKLPKKETRIIIKFKKIECLLLDNCPTDSNYLIIRIQPNQGIALEMNAKIPGEDRITPVKMDFCHSCLFGPNTPDAYENLYEDIIEGDQSVFIRNDEVETAWRITDKVKYKKLQIYKQGTYPNELKNFTKKHNIKWK